MLSGKVLSAALAVACATLVSVSTKAEVEIDAFVEQHGDEIAIDTTGEEPMVDALFRVEGGDTYQLDSAGLVLIPWETGWQQATIPLSRLEELSCLSTVTAVHLGRRCYPTLDESTEYINADDVHSLNPTGYTGQGVIIGVIDLGLDPYAADLQRPDGGTRVLWLWDHNREDGTAPSGYSFGSEFSAQQIDNGEYWSEPDEPPDGLVGLGHGTASRPGMVCLP